jgi:hypothetical protein
MTLSVRDENLEKIRESRPYIEFSLQNNISFALMIIYNTAFSQSTEAQSVSLIWRLAGNWAVRTVKTFLLDRSKSYLGGGLKLPRDGIANLDDYGELDSLHATAQSKFRYHISKLLKFET